MPARCTTDRKWGDTHNNALGVIAIGDVAFTNYQYEIFDTNGLEVKNGTIGNADYAEEEQMENPYAMMIVATMSITIASRSHNSYISSAYGYEYGSDEADSTVFIPGTGEKLATEYLKMLNELHGEE